MNIYKIARENPAALVALILLIVLLLWRPVDSQVHPQTFNITDFGAVCNGTTDDTLAINRALTAAKASSNYTGPNYGDVIVSGPQTGGQPVCLVGTPGFGINATGFTAWNNLGNGLSAGRLVFEYLNIKCTDPTSGGVICLDTSDSLNVDIANTVSVQGVGGTPPLIGLQEANVINGTACCIHHVRGQFYGNFIFTPIYNMGAESTTYYDIVASNGYITRGSINAVGVVSGGSGYNGGATATFTGVALTGGNGYGAVGTVTVTSGIVTKVLLTNNGIGYFISDQLTAPPTALGNNGGTGFSFTIGSLVNWGVVLDGQNHWGARSHWVGTTQPQDVQLSFTQINFVQGSLRGYLSSLWMIATTSPHFYHVYLNSEHPTLAQPCVYLYDNGVAQNLNPYFDIRCEANKAGGVGDFYFTGTNAAPNVESPYIRIDYEKGNNVLSPAMFNTDPALTIGNGGVVMNNADISWMTADKISMFDQASHYTVSGKISTWIRQDYNAPFWFSGQLCLGEFSTTQYSSRCSPPIYGPAEVIGGTQQIGIAFAGSCARVLTVAYQGALCNVQRASDSATTDLYPDIYGILDRTAYTSFCFNTTCSVDILYDQSGNGNNATASGASEPVLNITDPLLGNRASMTFVSGGATALVVPAAAAINDTFASVGGMINVVFTRALTGLTQGRFAYKSNGSTLGWDLRTSGSGNPKIEFLQYSSSGAADYVSGTSIFSNQAGVMDMEYQNTLSANTPAMYIQGLLDTPGSFTPYAGTVSSDSGQNLIIGNNAATGGTNSYAGNMAEIILYANTTALTPVQLEAMRRNEANFYNITTPVIH